MPTSDFRTGKKIVIAELTGLSETLRRIDASRDFYTDAEVRAAYDAAGRSIAVAARREAPKDTGLLRRAIVGKAFKLDTWRRWGPGAFGQVTLRRGARNRAPHANIIVAGRKGIQAKPGHKLKFSDTRGGGTAYPGKVAAVPADDFWRRGVRGAAERAERRVIISLGRAWNKRVGK